MTFLKPHSNNYLLLTATVLFMVVFLLTGTHLILDLHPYSTHQWRQSDSAAYVKNFYRYHHPLFKPATFNLAGTDGHVISEIPLLYWIMARIQQLVGEHYWVVRGLHGLVFFASYLYLVKIAWRISQKAFTSLLVGAAYLTSPFVYYYAFNFLPNVPGIAFSIIAAYYFLSYYNSSRVLHIVLATMFALLAALLKPTDGGILSFTVYCTVAWAFLRKQYHPEKRIKLGWLLSFLLFVAGNVVWILYIKSYNDHFGNHQNLTTIYPFWTMESGILKYTAKRVVTEWFLVYHSKFYLLLVAGGMVLYAICRKRYSFVQRTFVTFLVAGIVMYTLLWFKAYTDHDYYQLIYIFIILLFTGVAGSWAEHFLEKSKGKSVIWGGGLLILLAGMTVYNKNRQEDRYQRPVFNSTNVLYGLEPVLDSLGITDKHHVVCVPDRSPNISLNAINRFGYTEEFQSEVYNIDAFVRFGAAYLIITDSSYLTNDMYKPYVSHLVYHHEKGIWIYDLKR